MSKGYVFDRVLPGRSRLGDRYLVVVVVVVVVVVGAPPPLGEQHGVYVSWALGRLLQLYLASPCLVVSPPLPLSVSLSLPLCLSLSHSLSLSLFSSLPA